MSSIGAQAPPLVQDRTRLAADALACARRTGVLLTAWPSDARPDSGPAAIAIQQLRGRDRVGGWKCALPQDGRAILAPIDAATIVDAPGPVCVTTPDIRYEPELAFTLARDLPEKPGGHDRASILAAIGTTRLAVELVHGRFRDPDTAGFLDMLADDLFNEGIVLGPVVDLATPTAIVIAGEDGERTLPAAHPAIDPLLPLVWLADHLAAAGQPLTAGMTIITGSFTAAQIVRQGSSICLRYEGLGDMAVRFTFTKDRT